MRILITNDDGIHSPGLRALERVGAEVGAEVWVVAPELDQSGLAHSLTLNDPLRLRQVDERRFALRGTPTDCVIMALRKVMPERPDLILSGINVGRNVADDVLYSGTVAGAIEGTLLGIPSIALSQAFNHEEGRNPPWATAEAHAPGIIRRLIAFGFGEGLLFNLNFPNLPADQVRGIAVTRQGRQVHGMFADERRDGRGLPYFWLHYQRQPFDAVPGTDIHALEAGMISLTPLRLDMTDTDAAGRLAAAFPAG